mgnify:CR=1 FL=1
MVPCQQASDPGSDVTNLDERNQCHATALRALRFRSDDPGIGVSGVAVGASGRKTSGFELGSVSREGASQCRCPFVWFAVHSDSLLRLSLQAAGEVRGSSVLQPTLLTLEQLMPAGLLVTVPGPFWLVMIPAVEVAVAGAAIDVALVLMVEVIVFAARAYHRAPVETRAPGSSGI